MFCKFCGEKIDEKSLFCSKCGANLKEQPTSASIVEESTATVKSGRASFKNKILLFIESNSILLSLCITILTFFVPLQITNKKVILGIDVILFFKIKTWWGDLSILALIVATALFVLAIFFVIYTLVILKKEGFSSRNKCLNKIIIFNLVLSILYFVFGLVTLFLCDSSWNPWTLSFIPLLLQSPIFLVCIKKIRNNNCNELNSSNKNRLSKLFIISISTLLCFVFVFCGYIDYSNNNNNYDSSYDSDYSGGSTTTSITRSQAISYAKSSSTVQNEIANLYGLKFYYTPDWGTTTATKESNGDWRVVIKGTISGYRDDYKTDFVYGNKFTVVVIVYSFGYVYLVNASKY